jgi:CheY-like chemotaxis protein
VPSGWSEIVGGFRPSLVDPADDTARPARLSSDALKRSSLENAGTTPPDQTSLVSRSQDGTASDERRAVNENGHSPKGTGRLRCLIVDDDFDYAEIARDLLEAEGISVVGVATTGAQALRLLPDLWPDIALIDFVLGDENGLELIARIDRAGLTRETIMVMCSTYAEDDLVDAVMPGLEVTFLTKADLSGHAIRNIHGNGNGNGNGNGQQRTHGI